MAKLASLADRAVVEVGGPDRVSFLQGLVSNDVTEAGPGRAVWAALLSPQGKWLADFFIRADGETLLLDVEAAQSPMLVQKLTRHRLRAKVSVAPRPELRVFALWDGEQALPEYALAARDPRLPEAGLRILSRETLPTNASWEAWDRRRLELGLPDGSRDLEAEKSVLLEAGFDLLHGVSWTKGCYMGQELTARTHYRGLVKRRLVPVTVDGPPPPGTPVLRDGVEVGTMRSGRGDRALALLRVDALDGALTAAGARLSLALPVWWTQEETAG